MELTNVNDVTMSVDHDVPVVPVLQLQEVAHQGVPSHTAHKVGTSLNTDSEEREGEYCVVEVQYHVVLMTKNQ